MNDGLVSILACAAHTLSLSLFLPLSKLRRRSDLIYRVPESKTNSSSSSIYEATVFPEDQGYVPLKTTNGFRQKRSRSTIRNTTLILIPALFSLDQSQAPAWKLPSHWRIPAARHPWSPRVLRPGFFSFASMLSPSHNH
ncbi:hypothetical protein ASPVEDRAFT_420454 [Aspergillus versicolor CBS 583.65]|uniref:Uncharacterized protein n=1 Tax=Aspergillus versicolor CBS 583.65 TaxID=1036611 RepID=A0A1L9Q5A6_ASPVE|nr:uncharacterized protein ASPVEDRAFT_420454 [Aspergillus versicolor CBS 583.65]OJJ08947.1 hypothetical protein ASPVEDRAFT_420454 [Aspergillus versicolor CBS 583.65]